MEELTQKRLKQLLAYDSETGLFTRRISCQGGGKAGNIIGCKNPAGYLQIMIDGKLYLAHRLAWFYKYGKWPTKYIDHINRIRDDNMIENLREYINWKNTELTQERLKKLLAYNSETGIFTRKTSAGSRGKVGDIAGCKTSDGYLQIKIDGKFYYGHRLAWFYVYGKWPTKQLECINRIKTDNMICNLREYISWENVELTQKRLKKLLDYNSETGIFTRKTSIRGGKVGDIAGCKTSDGYLQIKIDGKFYYGHRLAWLYIFGKWPKKQIDHINRIRDDNMIENLRDISQKHNVRNAGERSDNTSGIKGIYWDKATNKWCAQISVDGKTKNLGRYADKLSAAKARYSAELKHGWQKHETFISSAKQYIDKYEKLSMKIQNNIRKNILKNGYNNNRFQI